MFCSERLRCFSLDSQRICVPFIVVAAAAEAKICTMCAFALSHTLTIVSASRDVLKRMSRSEIARSAQRVNKKKRKPA